MTLVVGPQAGIEVVVVGDGNHVEMPTSGDHVQHLGGGGQAVAGARVNV